MRTLDEDSYISGREVLELRTLIDSRPPYHDLVLLRKIQVNVVEQQGQHGKYEGVSCDANLSHRHRCWLVALGRRRSGLCGYRQACFSLSRISLSP